ncbi:MAG: hypothetical protein M3P08_16815 [Thermoproteota archaeon]|nr:hypothetical protein [Thermoproteota archaeon]
MVSKITILDAIYEKEPTNIFKSIASADSNSDILITQLKLTRKQYYSRMSRLIQAGLVKRQKGRYSLTTFGKVIYNAHVYFDTKIEIALQDYWKLMAIDSMENISSRKEHDNIISTLIENREIKSILLK